MLKFKRFMKVEELRKIRNKAYGVKESIDSKVSYKYQEGKAEVEIEGNMFDAIEGVEHIVSTIASRGGFREKEIYEYLLEEQNKKDKKDKYKISRRIYEKEKNNNL